MSRLSQVATDPGRNAQAIFILSSMKGDDLKVSLSAWASWAEFRNVFCQLTSQDPEERRLGVQRVQTWRSRAVLPVAVDLTATMVEIMLNDPKYNPDTQTPRSDHELQLMYSFAVIRLVNGIVDVHQRKEHAMSIAALARKIGFPVWIVDVRQEATHKEMPKLPYLRLAIDEGIRLLLVRYWKPQLSKIDKKCRTLKALSESLPPLPAFADTQLAGHVDETRLLVRFFDSMQGADPDENEALTEAMVSACERGTVNFSMRLARRLTFASCGFPMAAAEAASEDFSLASICDKAACTEGLAQLETRQLGPEESNRYLLWFQALLSGRFVGDRFKSAVGTLGPMLRKMCVERLVERPDMVDRVVNFLRALGKADVDSGAPALFKWIARHGLRREALDTGGLKTSEGEQANGPCKDESSIEDVEQFIRTAAKRRRTTEGRRSSTWTAAVGTCLDPSTLEIYGCLQHATERVRNIPSDSLAEKWKQWSTGGPQEASHAAAKSSQGGRLEANGSVPTVSPTKAQDPAVAESTPIESDEEIRQRRAAVIANLQPIRF